MPLEWRAGKMMQAANEFDGMAKYLYEKSSGAHPGSIPASRSSITTNCGIATAGSTSTGESCGLSCDDYVIGN